MRFRKISTWNDLDKWIGLTDRLYRNGHFIPPIRDQLRAVFRRPERYGTRAALYAVEDDRGNILARTTVHGSEVLDAKLGEPVQLFGFTEFVEDYPVFEQLIDGIRTIAHQKNRKTLFGPANLLPNESGGVISSGFEHRGFLDSAYNPPYYATFYARAGFSERFPSATYICDAIQSGPDPGSVLRFDDVRLAWERLEIRYGNRAKLKSQLKLLLRMLNASFAQRPYYTPISLDELEQRMEGLAYLLDERLLIYLLRDGEPVAFVVCIPDPSPFLAEINGNLNWINQLRLVLNRKHYQREAIVLIGGVVPGCEGAGYIRLLMRELFRNLRTGGYSTLRTTSIERNNPAARSTFLKMKGRVLHELAYYELRL